MPDLLFQGSQRAYDSVVHPNVSISTRDGVLLAADVYLPAHNGSTLKGTFPAIVERTPYLKDTTRYAQRGHWYARHGYAVVINDVRGRGSSEGTWYPFAREAPDGYDVVEWVAEQPWCTGQVGTMGASYAGSDQSALATLNPPHLAAQVIGQGTSNYHVSSLRQGGALEQRFIRYAFRMARTSREAAADADLRRILDDADLRVSDLFGPPLRFRPGRTALRLLPHYEQWAWDILTHGVYDDYWLQRGYTIDKYWKEHADVPTLFQSGWYDTYPRGAIANFLGLTAHKSSPMRLVLGPWRHGEQAPEDSTSGDVEFGIDSPLTTYDEMRLRFFDQHLKGMHTGLSKEPIVRYFVMGGQKGRPPADLGARLWHGGRWETADNWPPPEYTETPLYLHADGSLQMGQPPGNTEPTRYTYDPTKPVPTAGGSISASEDILPSGGFDQRGQPDRFFGHDDTLPIASRPDVISFETAPLKSPLEIAGPVEVLLFAASSALDTDFTAKLLDVYPHGRDVPGGTPGGYELNLCDSIIRARFRNGFDAEQLMTPGEVYEFRIIMYPTANHFAAGHRIRIDISSSNYPRFDANPNTGEPLGHGRRWLTAHQSIHHDADHPSRLLLHTTRT